jgi:hypothetical protein
MAGRDYLLPGESVEWVDSITCETFKTTINQTIRCSNWRTNAAGNPLCWDSDGNEIDPAANGTGASSDTQISQHTEPAGQVYYRLEAGNEELISNPIGVLEENLEEVDFYLDGELLTPQRLDDIRSEFIAVREVDFIDREIDDRVVRFRDMIRRIRVPAGRRLRKPRPPQDSGNQVVDTGEWKSKSYIEPHKIVTTISAQEGVPQKKETTVNIQIIPTH